MASFCKCCCLDRCHRIGQNTRVKTLYFVAVGTLDELLWKLLEKKFQDLGEFVEGQENQKMVVHKHYHGTKELFSIFSVDEVDLDEEEKWDEEAEAEGQELLALEHDLENDIDMLGKEELTMFSPDDDDELNGDDKPDQLASQSDKSEPILGCSEEEAILLSDDEEEAIAASVAPNIKNNYASVTNPSEDAKSPPSGEIQPATHNGNSEQINFDIERLRNCRAYNLLFDGPSFGIQLFILHHRMIVGRIENAVNCKPRIGDILVAINGQVFPFVKSLGEVIPYMKTAISRGSAELTFVECDDLTRFVKAKIDAEAKRRYKAMQAKLAEMPKKPAKAGEVIDLLEDDD